MWICFVICHEAFCLHVVSSSSCIPAVYLEPVLFLIPLQCVNLPVLLVSYIIFTRFICLYVNSESYIFLRSAAWNVSWITAGLRMFYRRLYFLAIFIYHKQRWPFCGWNTIANITSTYQLKCDGTRARNQISSFGRNGGVHLNRPGGRGVSSVDYCVTEVCGISCSNAGNTVFWGSVKSTGYPLHSLVSPLHLPVGVSPCAITFQLESTTIT